MQDPKNKHEIKFLFRFNMFIFIVHQKILFLGSHDNILKKI